MPRILAAALLSGLALADATAATLPSGFTETRLATGLASPTAFAVAPDGRVLVCLQGGQLRVIKDDALLPAPFVTLSVNSSGERGLLGVAFDPDFETNQHVYVYYTTATSPIHNRVSRFTASGDVALAGSEVAILDLDNLSSATNHNGGALHFGPDGYLYVAVGENATPSNAQSLSNLLGKMLRIGKDGSIPADNPFEGQATGRNRAIWALGLRNPFTFAFQPRTGRMFINDVGQSTWEEVNDGLAGSNYGWPATEGPTTNPAYRSPLYAYANDASTCAITGGVFYDPVLPQFPAEHEGKYFFADFCGGWIRRLDPATLAVATFATGISSPVDLKVDGEGRLLYLARGTGSVWRVEYTASQAPRITSHPQDLTVAEGQPASFSVSATGTPPLSYQWQRGGTDIPGAASPSYTLPEATAADDGATFRAVVTNAVTSATSESATLTVTTNTAPVATILSPAGGTTYAAGDTIGFDGAGTDAEDGDLPASALTWQVDFHHDEHVHPFLPATSGTTGGSFTVPRSGETSVNVWYRVRLTVRDSGGLAHGVFVDIHPRTVRLTLDSRPSGLGLTLDGQPVTAPATVASVVGMRRTIGAPRMQTYRKRTLRFRRWSDGGAPTHAITTPDGDATYQACYTPLQ